MIKDSTMLIERINGGIVISYDTAVDFYINMTLQKAESAFREEHGLKGKRIKRITIANDG